MDLVSNYVGELSAAQFGGNQNGVATNLDFDDDTFANLLEKQLNNQIDSTNTINTIGNLGMPSGLDICDVYGNSVSFEQGADNIKHIGFNMSSDAKKFSVSEILAFFPSLFESKPSLTENTTNGLFDFERKTAANQYSKYAKNVVTDISEFVSDALKLS